MGAVAKSLDCSVGTAIHNLVTFFGRDGFDKLNALSPAARRKAAIEKRAAAFSAKEVPGIVVSVKPIGTGYVPTIAAPKPVAPAPRAVLDTPEYAPHGTRLREPDFRLSDIQDVSVTIKGGVAKATIVLDANSSTFLYLCGWQARK